jgi:pyruvate formate lyase activating enzyme
LEAVVSNIQGYSIHDGPGIRTVVFLKGCVLNCLWCSNPECISSKPEVGFIKNLCKSCGNCAAVCQQGALTFEGQHPRIDRKKCIGCGDCALACKYNALVSYGMKMSLQEVLEAIKRDKVFYDASGGGVTVSGGEPLLQAEFVRALFDECHKIAIHTCIETSGCVDSSTFLSVLPATDYVLFDIKHLNPDKHLQFTGQSNIKILANAKLLAESGVEYLFRMPLIPGVNDDLQNIKETADFLKSLGNNANRIELMPYHRLGESKYDALNRQYAFRGVSPFKPEKVESVKQIFEANGITCLISR